MICSSQAGFIAVGILTSQEKLGKNFTALQSGGHNKHVAQTRLKSVWLLNDKFSREECSYLNFIFLIILGEAGSCLQRCNELGNKDISQRLLAFYPGHSALAKLG